MTNNRSKVPSVSSISFRTVLTLVIILLLAWFGFSINHYLQTKEQIRALFQNEAGEMATTLLMGQHAMSRIMDRLEEEQANRLLAVGFWLRDLEQQEPLNLDTLETAAQDTDIFNIVMFDPN
ncbi:hypothetical protein K8I31_04125, partial [bacterium]|nr:hypothetical protein [bacterium]